MGEIWRPLIVLGTLVLAGAAFAGGFRAGYLNGYHDCQRFAYWRELTRGYLQGYADGKAGRPQVPPSPD